MKNKKDYLTAVSIECGIITLLDKDGCMVQYRQRGIERMGDEQRGLLIAMGMLCRTWELYPELPGDIALSFEDPTIMGIAREAYPSEIIEAIQVTPKLRKKYLEE